jgi:hypothetical protein
MLKYFIKGSIEHRQAYRHLQKCRIELLQRPNDFPDYPRPAFTDGVTAQPASHIKLAATPQGTLVEINAPVTVELTIHE